MRGEHATPAIYLVVARDLERKAPRFAGRKFRVCQSGTTLRCRGQVAGM